MVIYGTQVMKRFNNAYVELGKQLLATQLCTLLSRPLAVQPEYLGNLCVNC